MGLDGTWIYLSVILVALIAGLIVSIQGPVWRPWASAAVLLVCSVAFTQRNAVTSVAFGPHAAASRTMARTADGIVWRT